MRVLEFKEYELKDEETLKIRKEIIEKELNLNNIKYTSQFDIKKNYYIILYYHNDENIYLDEEKIINIIKLFKKDFKKENNELHYSKNPRRISNFLDIYPEKFNYFKFDNLYEKEHMERIDKYQLPLYKVMRENKYALLKLLKSHIFNYKHDDINYFLLHDRLPFVNYDHLKEILNKYYSIEKEKYHKIFKRQHEEACLYLMSRNEVIIIEEPVGFNIYTKEPYRGENEENVMRQIYIDKIDKQVKNNRDLFLDNMSNKEIISLVINKENIAYPCEEEIYHHGYYNNGIYKCEEEIDKDKNLKIDKNLIDIEILNDDDNFYIILIKVKKEIIELSYFYIPNNKEFILTALLEKMWERGDFLTDFGKAVYINEDIILEKELRVPKWLESNNEESFKNLIKKIN